MAEPNPSADPPLPAPGEVLQHLEQAEEAFVEQQQEWRSRLAELGSALQDARETNHALGARLEQAEAERRREEERAKRQRDRAARLTEVVSELHRGLFHASVPELVLRACLSISGATRGLYLAWREPPDSPRVRAAVGVDGYPDSPPSGFLLALARAALEKREPLVCGEAVGADAPPPERESERFRNCALAPVLLGGRFDGVILVADKPGRFDDDDLEAMLSVGGQAAVALENSRLQQELERAYVATITVLADAVEAKDPYTHGHCEMASLHARLTAERLGLPEREKAVVCYAALLHDVGKIGVSDGILNKPGPLLQEEWELVRTHVRVGYDLIRSVPAMGAVAEAVLHHHERFDGTGYPDGLAGEEIPIASRIVAVVDTYGAMITRRSYKEAYSEEHSRRELQRCAGTQFDPAVVEAFLAVLDSPESHAPEGASNPCGLVQVFGAHRPQPQPAA